MPPPFRYVSFPISSVLVFLSLVVVLFSLPACPEPSTHHDGFVESSTEGGVEKTESTAEITSEESANPEDGAPIEQEPIREEGPEPEIMETDKPYIERVNGNGSQLPVNAAASPSKIDNLPAAPTKPSPSRVKDALVIEGNLLNQIDRWVLQSKDLKNNEQIWANTQIQRNSNMKHTLRPPFFATITSTPFLLHPRQSKTSPCLTAPIISEIQGLVRYYSLIILPLTRP